MTFGESCFAISKTCASNARPARRCSTLGVLECMRLPGPAARMMIFTKSGGNSAGYAMLARPYPARGSQRCSTFGRLSRQLGKSHQELIHRARALSAFPDRPDDERLAPAHIAGGEHFRY